MEALEYTEELVIQITSQALSVLSQSKYSLNDFKEWIRKEYKFSLGGHNVVIFLEEKSKLEQKQKEKSNNKNDSEDSAE